MIFHDSHNKYYKNPLTPVIINSEIIIRLKYNGNNIPYLRIWYGKEEFIKMNKFLDDIYQCKVKAPATPCQLWYDFIIYESDGKTIRYGNSQDLMGGEGEVYNYVPKGYLIVVYDKNFSTPNYMHNGVIYQIFPDRFCRGNYNTDLNKRKTIEHKTWSEDPLLLITDKNDADNMAYDFFMGNIQGIIDKLDYIKNLGADIIYLNPIFEASANHRYDTSDYSKVDSYLGTIEDFTRLKNIAKEKDIKIILDGVFNHTGADSKYFDRFNRFKEMGAYQSKESKYYDWYQFKTYPDDYKCWWGIKNLPQINKNTKSFIEYMFNDLDGIIPSWIKKGAKGWRLDVADDLPLDFLRNIRKKTKSIDEQAVIIGEVWEDASNKVTYDELRCYCLGDTIDSVMNYPLRTAIIDFMRFASSSFDLVRLIAHQKEVYPTPFYYSLMNLLGSHDKARILNVLCHEEGYNLSKEESKTVRLSEEEYNLSKKRYLMALSILAALPGAPTIYYGDEAGLQGTSDPWNRRTFPWGYEDVQLQNEVKKILMRRKNSQLLKTGHLVVEAINNDSLKIVRYSDYGFDVFGNAIEEGAYILYVDRKRNIIEWRQEKHFNNIDEE